MCSEGRSSFSAGQQKFVEQRLVFCLECSRAATYVEGNLFGLPPGEAEYGCAVSVEDLEDEHPLAEDSKHDASLGPLLGQHSVEVDTVFCQLLANLQHTHTHTRQTHKKIKTRK